MSLTRTLGIVAFVLGCCACGEMRRGDPGAGAKPPDNGSHTVDPQKEPPRSVPSAPRIPKATDWPQLQTEVPLYELHVAPADLQALDHNIDDHTFEVPGTFGFNGMTWDVMVRYRGQSTRYLPKKPFEVKFPDTHKFVGDQKALQLLAEYNDGGLLTEKMWWDLAAAQGLRVPKSQFVRLNLNGSFYGLMLEVESVKKQFLRNHGFGEDSDIYRCGQFDCEMRDPPPETYQLPWSKETNSSAPWDNLWEFLAQVNRTSPAQFHASVENTFEYEEYLAWLAVDAAMGEFTIQDTRSYLVWDEAAQRWAYVPWDLNNTVALMNRLNGWPQWPNTTRPLKNFTVYDEDAYVLADERATDPWLYGAKPAWSSLNTRMLDDEAFRQKLIDRLQALLGAHFREEEIGPRAEAMHALIAPYLAQDPFVDQTLAANSVPYLKEYVRKRRTFLQEHLTELQQHNETALKIDRVGLDANGRPFIELWNGGSTPAHLARMWVSAWLRVPRQAELPDITIPPTGSIRLEADQLAGLSPVPNESQFGLFGPDGRVPVDAIFLPPLKPGDTWARSPRGSENWTKL